MSSIKRLYDEHTWKSNHLDWQIQKVPFSSVSLCCFIWIFSYWTQTGLILYTGIKETSCKSTRVLKKSYWKVLLPCRSPSASRGRTEKSVSWDQNCSRPKPRTATAEQPTYTQQTEKNACCPRQGRPALLTDGQMLGKVLFRRNRNAISMFPVITGKGSVCSRVYNWWQVRQVNIFPLYGCWQQWKLIVHGPAPRTSLKCLNHAVKSVPANTNMDYRSQLCVAKRVGEHSQGPGKQIEEDMGM